MRIGALVLSAACLLTGCATAPPTPMVFETKDQVSFDADLALCRTHAAAARQSLSASGIATAGGKAALQSAPSAAINPLVPAVAAAGGATAEALSELNILGQVERHLIVHCMERKGDKSGAYFVLDPND